MTQRDRFEAWYARGMRADGWKGATGATVKAMRNGDHYGFHRHYLNGCWHGWKARNRIKT